MLTTVEAIYVNCDVTKQEQVRDLLKIEYSGKDCMPCPSRDLCIRLVKDYKRGTANQVQVQPMHEAIWPYMLDSM